MTGTVQLEWQDAETSQPVDQSVGNLKASQDFHVSASQSSVIFFPTCYPCTFYETPFVPGDC